APSILRKKVVHRRPSKEPRTLKCFSLCGSLPRLKMKTLRMKNSPFRSTCHHGSCSFSVWKPKSTDVAPLFAPRASSSGTGLIDHREVELWDAGLFRARLIIFRLPSWPSFFYPHRAFQV